MKKEILGLLTQDIRDALASCDEDAQEIRLRCKRKPRVVFKDKTVDLIDKYITVNDLQTVLDKATKYSVHTFMDNMKSGFITIEGGHRIGVCGSIVMKDGYPICIKNFSSLNIRIAKQVKGCANEIINKIDEVGNVIIISPPGFGKTTLLRDVIRGLSDSGLRVSVADERMELCGMYQGIPQFDIGQNTDVIDTCPKHIASMILIKTMTPDILAMDEITSKEDIESVKCALNCGVKVIATAHASDMDEFKRRPLYKKLIEMRLFDSAILVDKKRDYKFVSLRDEEEL